MASNVACSFDSTLLTAAYVSGRTEPVVAGGSDSSGDYVLLYCAQERAR